ncbi:MAG: hypothetical protein JST75_09285 [Bacteroidetes bacterium]|nr:hypothetical protein [Bacteroidota bacterium]
MTKNKKTDNIENENLVDYTSGVFKKNFSADGCKYYFIIAPEMYPDMDGLGNTGKMHCLICSTKGTHTFLLTKSNGYWKPEDKNIIIDDALLKLIDHEITNHKF